MSTLDLVEEFRGLDDVRESADVESSTIGKLSGEHERIGELPVGQEEGEKAFGSTPVGPHATPSCAIVGCGRIHVGGAIFASPTMRSDVRFDRQLSHRLPEL